MSALIANMYAFRVFPGLFVLLLSLSAQAQSPSRVAEPPPNDSATTAESSSAYVTTSREPGAIVALQAQGLGTTVSSNVDNPTSTSTPIEQPPAALPRDTTSKRRWYGWQTLATDGSALALTIASLQLGGIEGDGLVQNSLSGLAAGTYLLGGPVVHALHGHWGKAGLSLSLRTGLPLVLGGGAYLASSCGSAENSSDPSDCGLEQALSVIAGATIGMLAASTIDAAAIAKETVPAPPSLTPAVKLGRESGWVGVAGRF